MSISYSRSCPSRKDDHGRSRSSNHSPEGSGSVSGRVSGSGGKRGGEGGRGMPVSCGGTEAEEGSDDENGMSSAHPDPQWSRMTGGTKGWRLRGVEWRVKLGILPKGNASVDSKRRATADGRRKYADLRRRLLVDPHIMDEDQTASQLRMDNPLSQDPESVWGRYFRNAELEKLIDIDLTRLYPEHGVFFQSSPCQAMMRRILLVWSLIHPHFSYRQGMHELLAPLLYVLHVDVVRLSQVKHRFEDLFDDRFDSLSLQERHVRDKVESAQNFCGEMVVAGDSINFKDGSKTVVDSSAVDPEEQRVDLSEIIHGSDMYGVEGELGALLSARFLEHDAYCMLDALLNGQGGAVAMAEYFQASCGGGKPPVIEASAAVYQTLAAADITLYSHLVEIQVEPQFFALRWLRLLFGREFVLEDLLRIWDAIFEADNTPLYQHGREDDQIMKISQRGALISSLSVSMLLYVRPALLAAPDVTACLQRLLNFPRVPDVRDLIEGAKSLQPLAEAAVRSPGKPVLHNIRTSDLRSTGGKHLRNGSISPPTPQRRAMRLPSSSPSSPDIVRLSMSLPGSYWEEKWTHSVLQKKTPDELFSPRTSRTEPASTDSDHVEGDGSSHAGTVSRSASEGRHQRPDQAAANLSVRSYDSAQESSDDGGQEMLRRGGESSSHDAAQNVTKETKGHVRRNSGQDVSLVSTSPRATQEIRGHFRRNSGQDVSLASTSPTLETKGHFRRNSLQHVSLPSTSTSGQETGRSFMSASPRKSYAVESSQPGPVSHEVLENAMFGDDSASIDVVDKFEVTGSTASDPGDENNLTLQEDGPVHAVDSSQNSVEPSKNKAVGAVVAPTGSSSEILDISDSGTVSMDEIERNPSFSLAPDDRESSEDSLALEQNNALQSELGSNVQPVVEISVTEGNDMSQEKECSGHSPFSGTPSHSQGMESRGDHGVEDGIPNCADTGLPSKSKPPLPPSRLGRFSWVWTLGRSSFAEKTVTTKVPKEDSPGNEVTPILSDATSDPEVSISAAATAAQRRKKSWWRANSDVVPEESVAATSTDLENGANASSDVLGPVDSVKPALESPVVASGEQLKEGPVEDISAPTKDTARELEDTNPSEESRVLDQEPVTQPEDTTPCVNLQIPCQSAAEEPKDVTPSATLQAEGQDAAKEPEDLTPSAALQALGHDTAKRSRDITPSAALQALGQAVLDHVQVLESALAQKVTGLGIENMMWTPAVRERSESSSKIGLGNKGQGAALAAIAELRKISRALQQM